MTNNKICYELKIQVLEEHKDILSHVLEELDIGDFVYGQVDCDIEAEYDPSKIIQDLYEKIKQNSPIIIYNENKEYLESVEMALKSLFPKMNIPIEKNTFIFQEIADQNWRESWKESFKPVLIQDMFAILPPWESISAFSQKYKIVINPGMAFGTGQHETTRLCLEIMANYQAPERFFDVGTGSGILAIAAKLLGSKFVLANDIDPECMAVANENVKNNVQEVIHLSSLPVSEIQEQNFDMIVANIQSRPLKILIPEIMKRVADYGVVILSGILVSEKDDFIEFLKQNHAKLVETKNLNDWCAIVIKR